MTFDTSCINSSEDESAPPAIRELEKMHAEGKIEIFKADVVDTELGEGNESLRLRSQKYSEDLGVLVWGHSRWGHSLWGGPSVDYPLEEIKDTVFPDFSQMSKKSQDRAIRDAMHLATHRMYRRQYFVTRDKHHIIKARTQLAEKFGIVVITPDECLAKLSDLSKRPV
jgi:hypothetical protein